MVFLLLQIRLHHQPETWTSKWRFTILGCDWSKSNPSKKGNLSSKKNLEMITIGDMKTTRTLSHQPWNTKFFLLRFQHFPIIFFWLFDVAYHCAKRVVSGIYHEWSGYVRLMQGNDVIFKTTWPGRGSATTNGLATPFFRTITRIFYSTGRVLFFFGNLKMSAW